VAIFLGLASTAFCVATIVLAVQNADLENDLQDALDKIDALTVDTTSTSSTSTSTSTTTTTANPNGPTDDTEPGSTTTPGVGGDTTPSAGTSPGGETSPSSSTGSTTNPIYPTLPTGLPDPEKVSAVQEKDVSSEKPSHRVGKFSAIRRKVGMATNFEFIKFQLSLTGHFKCLSLG